MSTGRKAEQSESTRGELIAVGRRLFAERGYADTSTEDLVRTAGMTRGALYHHFKDKRALFEAVFEDVEQSLMANIGAKANPTADAWTRLVDACKAFLDSCLERDVQQVVLIDGPSVLSWDRWREIEERYALGAVIAMLQASIDAGFLMPRPVVPLAHLILAAVNEAGMVIAKSDDVQAARAEVGGAFEHLLAGLRTS
jgi:AcrR family transcriptional regulator